MSAIFISYRHEDAQDSARALYESLLPWFGKKRLFMDVEAIGLGTDFRREIERALFCCGAFLAKWGIYLTQVTQHVVWPAMEDYPRNLAEFEARFSTEAACREYLIRLRWPDGFRCPRCGGRKTWPVRGVLLQCSGCGYQSSVTAGTIFQDTRKPLALWFRAIGQSPARSMASAL